MSSDQDSVRDAILRCLREEKPTFAEKLQDSTPTSEVEIDSIDIIQVVFKLEDMFHVSLDIDPSARFETVGEMLTYLETLILQAQRTKIEPQQNG